MQPGSRFSGGQSGPSRSLGHHLNLPSSKHFLVLAPCFTRFFSLCDVAGVCRITEGLGGGDTASLSGSCFSLLQTCSC